MAMEDVSDTNLKIHNLPGSAMEERPYQLRRGLSRVLVGSTHGVRVEKGSHQQLQGGELILLTKQQLHICRTKHPAIIHA